MCLARPVVSTAAASLLLKAVFKDCFFQYYRMGQVLVAEAVIETVFVVLGVGAAACVAAGALAAILEALQNCSCGNAPDIPDVFEHGVPLTKTLKVSEVQEIEALTLMSAQLKGHQIKNSSVPYSFSFVVGKGSSTGRRVYHAVVLIHGQFDVQGDKFDYMLAERWCDGINVIFFTEKAMVFSHLQKITVGPDAIPLTDCSESPTFHSMVPAIDMVQYVQDDLGRELRISDFKGEGDLANLRITNCVAFAIRAGMLLAGPDNADNFVKTCGSAIRGP